MPEWIIDLESLVIEANNKKKAEVQAKKIIKAGEVFINDIWKNG